MAIKNKSVAIRNPEFLNLSPLAVNTLMSKCDIKVLYTGKNRNGSMISKEVATKMADTLRGSPIVGYYRKDKEDFGDHGHRMILDVDGIKEEVLTIPYGFVSTDAKVWFQVFEDTDEFGNTVEREYLMCEGYIWNGQFNEADKILKEGQPQSMEIEGSTLEGHWANDSNTGRDFFIITDAEFSKLCILGDDVEPCFEGASIAAPASTFSFIENSDVDFKAEFSEMINTLKFALEGGNKMDNEKTTEEVLESAATPEEAEVPTESEKVEETSDTSTTSATPDVTESEKKEEEEDKKADEEEKKDEDEEDKPASEHSLSIEAEYAGLQSKYSALENSYAALQNKVAELETFYNAEMTKRKDALIDKFYMLSDEDKKDVIDNKDKYSLEDIESKLAVICFRKKVNFNLDDSEKNDNTLEEPTMFTLTMGAAVEEMESDVPDWVKAVESNKNR